MHPIYIRDILLYEVPKFLCRRVSDKNHHLFKLLYLCETNAIFFVFFMKRKSLFYPTVRA